MVKAGLSPRLDRPVLRVILRSDARWTDAAPDAVMVEAGADLPARLGALAGVTPTLLLRLPRLDGKTDRLLDDALPFVAGIVLGACADAGDLVRLGTRLAVREALADRPDGAVFTIAELAPAALLAPLGLAAARPRLAGLLWDADTIATACRAPPRGFAEGGAAEVVRATLALAGAALGLPVYDTASDDAGLEKDAAAAWRLGFAGKLAAHPGQLPVLFRLFASG